MTITFEQLQQKVLQAEDALEAHEREAAANLRQLRASWVAGWTPGRILLAGLASGFLVGRAEPLGLATKGTGIIRMLTAVSGLMATVTAQHAATEAEQAAETAEDAAVTGAAGAAGSMDAIGAAFRAGMRQARPD